MRYGAEDYCIEKFIPVGYDRRVTRAFLQNITGLSDRMVRDEIAAAGERGVLIVSSDGGYFLPRKSDGPIVEDYIRQEDHRSRTQAAKVRRLKRQARIMMGLPEDPRDIPGQMRMEL